MPKPTTVEQLAAMVQRGFESTASKTELEAFRAETRESFASVTSAMQAIVDTMDLMRADLRDIKVTLGGLVRTVTVLEESVQTLDKRVTRLEERANLRRR
jgi:hypothetical protein